MGEGSGKALSFSATTNGLSYKDTSLSLGNGSNYMNPWYNFEINLQSQFLKAGVVSESGWGGRADEEGNKMRVTEYGLGRLFCLALAKEYL